MSIASLTRVVFVDVNVALNKTVHAHPLATNQSNAVDGDWNTEAHMGYGNMSYIAVDLESQCLIENTKNLIRPNGKLIIHS